MTSNISQFQKNENGHHNKYIKLSGIHDFFYTSGYKNNLKYTCKYIYQKCLTYMLKNIFKIKK